MKHAIWQSLKTVTNRKKCKLSKTISKTFSYYVYYFSNNISERQLRVIETLIRQHEDTDEMQYVALQIPFLFRLRKKRLEKRLVKIVQSIHRNALSQYAGMLVLESMALSVMISWSRQHFIRALCEALSNFFYHYYYYSS